MATCRRHGVDDGPASGRQSPANKETFTHNCHFRRRTLEVQTLLPDTPARNILQAKSPWPKPPFARSPRMRKLHVEISPALHESPNLQIVRCLRRGRMESTRRQTADHVCFPHRSQTCVQWVERLLFLKPFIHLIVSIAQSQKSIPHLPCSRPKTEGLATLRNCRIWKKGC